MATTRSPLKHLAPAWYAAVMGLAGLSLAWDAAVPLLGDGAFAGAIVIGAIAAVVFIALATASLWRARRHPEAWAEDLKHPVRHLFIATLPIALIQLVTAGVTAGLQGPVLAALWWAGSLAQLSVTVWVVSRWWRGPQAGGLQWASLTPGLFIPAVGNLPVPLAGVPLGQPEWAAAHFGLGLLFWPVVLVLLLVRLAQQGIWPERLLPGTFIFIAPPAAVGLSALRLGAPIVVSWTLRGVALFSLLWVAPLLRRIPDQPFGVAHWGISFPMAALTALTLRLAPNGLLSMLGIAPLALTSLLIAALTLATVRGLRDVSLLEPETVTINSSSSIATA